MLNASNIQNAGGDWAGFGEITGDNLLNMIKDGKISVMFANKAILVGVELPDGQAGTYNLPHVEDIANFS